MPNIPCQPIRFKLFPACISLSKTESESGSAPTLLTIGSITVPQSVEIMRQFGFTQVVTLTNARHRPQLDRIEGIQQLWVDIEDNPFEDILICLEGICTWIEDALGQDLAAEHRAKLASTLQTRRGEQDDDEGPGDIVVQDPAEIRSSDKQTTQPPRVLIHCIQGISRSGAILVAYLMRSQQLSYESTLKMAQSARAMVAPNSGFADQLRLWQQLQYTIHAWGETTTTASLKDEYLTWRSNRGILLSRSKEDQQKSLLLEMENIMMESRARKNA